MLTIKEILKSKELKATPQRIAVYAVMKKLGHASADMVVSELKEVFPTLTVATIYNVLESLINVGLLVRRLSSNNKMYFDVNTYDHAHFYCRETETYKDYDDEELVKLVNEYLKNKNISNFNIQKIDIQLIGSFKK